MSAKLLVPLHGWLLLACCLGTLLYQTSAPLLSPQVHHRSHLDTAAPLQCSGFEGQLLLRRNALAANDSVHGPLELEVGGGCSSSSSSSSSSDGGYFSPGPAAAACLRGRHVVFIGDSTTRFSYLNFIHWLHSGSWDVGSPPLERDDGVSWGNNSWASFFEGTSARVPHICDCERCHSNQLFEEASRWDIGGVRMLCAMENRYYVHPTTGTRATFILQFGANPIGWNAPEFLGVPCFPHCPQQGCAPGKCYPPAHAAPPLEAIAALLAALRPSATDIVLSSGAWGGFEDAGDALVAALRGAPGQPRVYWRTPYPPRPGKHPGALWSPTWRTPRTSAAFEQEGWRVIPAGSLVAATMALVDLRPLMPCQVCIEAVEGRLADTAPHWSCTYCVMRAGTTGGSGGGEGGRHEGLLAELGPEGGRTKAWPWEERDDFAGLVMARSSARAGGEGGGEHRVPVSAVFDDWVHVAPTFNRLVNALTIAYLCEV
jgi:hypothetical protein